VKYGWLAGMGEGITPFEVEATGRLGQAAMTLIKAVGPRDETFILPQFYASPIYFLDAQGSRAQAGRSCGGRAIELLTEL
jgi:hypothetical protein